MPVTSVVQPAWRSSSWFAWLELMRPANVVTALADSLAGIAVAMSIIDYGITSGTLPGLLLASACLYAGGVMLNDVFDYRIDCIERPERPLPSGRVPRAGAAIVGMLLLGAGVGFAALAGRTSALLAAAIMLLVIAYDAGAKHHALGGPLVMGLCRGLNLLLGMSIAGPVLAFWWPLLMLPLAYIAAITLLSRGEVHGGTHANGWLAIGILLAALASLALLSLTAEFTLLPALPFIVMLLWRIGPPFLRAAREPQAPAIRMAVKAGVLSIICLDAVLGAGFNGLLHGLAILLLLPTSVFLARLFAVT